MPSTAVALPQMPWQQRCQPCEPISAAPSQVTAAPPEAKHQEIMGIRQRRERGLNPRQGSAATVSTATAVRLASVHCKVPTPPAANFMRWF